MIGVQILTYYNEKQDVEYKLNTNFKNGKLAEFSMLLSALHLVERDLIDLIDACEPDLHISE